MGEKGKVGGNLRVSTIASAIAAAMLTGTAPAADAGATSALSTSADAIGGTGRTDAIGGTGKTDAIGGTGRTDAIGGTGRTDAIGGTGRTDAIGGTGRTDAIGGTGKTDAIGGTGKSSDALVLLGPASQVTTDSGPTYAVVGQAIHLSKSTALIGTLTQGSYVEVYGKFRPDGTLDASSVRVRDDMYVPGASAIVVSGKVDAVDRLAGQAKVGQVVIDYTPSMWESVEVSLGDVITATGTQPSSGGVALARTVDKLTTQ
jgi:Domain of unknown function (DUF5666)